MAVQKTVLEVLEDKFLISRGCWEWTGWKNRKGYGCLSIRDVNKAGQQRKTFGHRIMFELFVGPIPQGKQVDHLCRNRGCVRPDHLELVTCKENLMRGQTHAARLAARTHCDKGHEFTSENTHFRKDGSRRCRECNRVQCRDYSKRHPRGKITFL